jgi:hypothetical protein
MTSKTLMAVCALGLSLAGPALAGKIKSIEWKAIDLRSGKNDDKKAKDISGISCTTPASFPRTCLVIDDNSQSAQVVTLIDGRVEGKSMVKLIDNGFGKKKLELDGEGVAYDGTFFYVIGSHGHPRDKDNELDPVKDASLIAARIEAASQIIKVKQGPNGSFAVDGEPISLTKAIKEQPALASYADQRLEKNGLTIEGIAIRGGTLLAGFRAPTLSAGCAVVLSASVKSLENGNMPDTKQIKLHLGDGIGIRDLASDGDRVLILAGPAADVAGPYSIFSWDGRTEDGFFLLGSLSDVAGAGDGRKAEALLPISSDEDGKKLLILFDNEPEGSPLLITVPPENLQTADTKTAMSCP